jgi:DNA-binding beta-propeller fold protein YncE
MIFCGRNLHLSNPSILIILSLLLLLMPHSIAAQTPQITRIATNLQNPRGIAVLPNGRLLVVQAGTGFVSDNPLDNTGKLSLLEDLNADSDYEDDREITDVVTHLPGYNILYQFNPGRDEIVGAGDVAVLDDGRIFFTLDDHFELLSIVEVSPTFERVGNLVERESTLNSIAYDAERELFYVAESSSNVLSAVMLDGSVEIVAIFDLLAHNQQPVPSGIAIDPLTGDVLVALFSGQLWDYYGSILSFMPGDAKIVRVNPITGIVTDEITGLTTAVDVAVDEIGNVYVVELTTQWATPTMSHQFDLYAVDAPPDAGGYARFSGRVTMFPLDNGEPVILADNLDAPTNITYHEGALYVSVGQGTPQRPIWGDTGLTEIVGEICKITLNSP